jgi:pimeloyl-ACP methyl ester carboxylesterase
VSTASRERFADVGRGITLCYDEVGEADATPVVMVAGLGQQLVSWPLPLCEAIAAEGYRVVRFDNRDSGRSTHTSAPVVGLGRMLTGRIPAETYELYDMAADLRGLLDALGVDQAHLVGASMGGMIAQTAAARYPDRVRSLTSIFSTTGAPRVGRPHWTTWLRLAATPPATAAAAGEAEVRMFRHIGSHGYMFAEDDVREAAVRAFERDSSSEGVARQLAAILKSGDRTAQLASITAPTLVVHGDRDRMVATSGGRATHQAIPDARLWIVPGLGHDYPAALWPTLVARLTGHFRLADGETPQLGPPPARVEQQPTTARVAVGAAREDRS